MCPLVDPSRNLEAPATSGRELRCHMDVNRDNWMFGHNENKRPEPDDSMDVSSARLRSVSLSIAKFLDVVVPVKHTRTPWAVPN